MKDYKLSELKEICNSNYRCEFCDAFELCSKLNANLTFYDLEIDEVDEDEDFKQEFLRNLQNAKPRMEP